VQLAVVGTLASRGRELRALAYVMARYWVFVFPIVRAQLRRWQERAEAIPDPTLRRQALTTLDDERLSAAGAALFAATVGQRDPTLVHTLVAYQIICDYLDTLAEQPSPDPVANGTQLHRALADALAPGTRQEDYYRLHSRHEDGGYLAALVDACREGCQSLPTYALVREAARREAQRNEVQGLNHGPAAAREHELRAWADEQDHDSDALWFELAAAGSSSLGALALIAAAADPATSIATAERTRASYFPWVDALNTLLDSLADRERDELTGELSFVAQYDSEAAMVERLRVLTDRAIAGVRALPRGERHVVLIAGMIAMHLSAASAWLPRAKPATLGVLRAAPRAVVATLLGMLRTWRIARGIQL
jgi:tetraprenyl-beta-curcumene synthase